MNEHPSQPIDYATVPGAWNFRHFNDSSRQLVHPTLREFGRDELVQLQTASVVGRADAEGGQRRSCCGHLAAFWGPGRPDHTGISSRPADPSKVSCHVVFFLVAVHFASSGVIPISP